MRFQFELASDGGPVELRQVYFPKTNHFLTATGFSDRGGEDIVTAASDVTPMFSCVCTEAVRRQALPQRCSAEEVDPGPARSASRNEQQLEQLAERIVRCTIDTALVPCTVQKETTT